MSWGDVPWLEQGKSAEEEGHAAALASQVRVPMALILTSCPAAQPAQLSPTNPPLHAQTPVEGLHVPLPLQSSGQSLSPHPLPLYPVKHEHTPSAPHVPWPLQPLPGHARPALAVHLSAAGGQRTLFMYLKG